MWNGECLDWGIVENGSCMYLNWKYLSVGGRR